MHALFPIWVLLSIGRDAKLLVGFYQTLFAYMELKFNINTHKKELAIASLNCRNVKSSVNEIRDICKDYDVLLLQETWLANFEVPVLANIHGNFYGKGISSIDSTNDLSVGRPHGGLAVLWHEEVGNHCSIYIFISMCLILVRNCAVLFHDNI